MSKKCLSALLAILMLVSVLPVSAFAAEGEQGDFTFPAPELRVLTKDETIGNQSFKAGMIVLEQIPDSLPNFTVEIRKTGSEGEPFEFYSDGFGGGMQSAQKIYIGYYFDGVLETGSYDVSVYYNDPDGDVRVPLSPTTTITHNYTSPGQQYGTPTDVAWTEDNDFNWTLPDNAGENFNLFVRFGKKQENGGIRIIGYCGGHTSDDTSRFFERFNERVNRYGEGDYCFSVRVLSTDIMEIWHSHWSDWSELRHIDPAGAVKDGIDKITDGLTEASDAAAKTAAVDAVRKLDANSLASSLAADNNGTGVTASLAALEEKLGLTATVVKTEDAGIDVATEKVSVVGAGFNSTDKSKAPTLTISKPAAELELPVQGYVNANAIQVDLSLGDGVDKNADGSLLVPVRITLPVPGNLDPQRLRILHFGGDGHYDRAIVPYVYEDNGTWMASFVVTHLSPFAFIETAPEDPEPPEPSAPFTVTFNANGGGALDPGAAETDAGGKLASLPVPTRGGYDFAGWYTEAAGGDRVTADTVFRADSTIYAHWTKQSGGSGGSGGSGSGGSGGSGSSKPVTPDVPTTPDRPEVPAIDASERFGDIAKDAWYADHVSYVVSRGLMNGTGGGSFAPDAQLSRAMLAQILYNYSDRPAVGGKSPFADVGGGWYADAVIWASENGVVQGKIDGTFAPNAAVTREQAAVMLYRFAQKLGLDTGVRGDLSAFADSAAVSDYAREALAWASGCGLINGSEGRLDPAGSSTRAQIAAMLQRFCENIAQ